MALVCPHLNLLDGKGERYFWLLLRGPMQFLIDAAGPSDPEAGEGVWGPANPMSLETPLPGKQGQLVTQKACLLSEEYYQTIF